MTMLGVTCITGVVLLLAQLPSPTHGVEPWQNGSLAHLVGGTISRPVVALGSRSGSGVLGLGVSSSGNAGNVGSNGQAEAKMAQSAGRNGGLVVSGNTRTITHTVSHVVVSGTQIRTSGNEQVSETDVGNDGNTSSSSSSSSFELIDISQLFPGMEPTGLMLHRSRNRTIQPLKFLHKYGYLLPGQKAYSRKAKRVALRLFQAFLGLEVTGFMDQSVQMLMDSSRCGVEDMLGSGRMGRLNRLRTNGTSLFEGSPGTRNVPAPVDVVVDSVGDNGIGSSGGDFVTDENVVTEENAVTEENGVVTQENVAGEGLSRGDGMVVNRGDGVVTGGTGTMTHTSSSKFIFFNSRTRRYSLKGSKWGKNDLTYYFENFTPDLSEAQVRTAVERAMQLWADVTPLTFTEVTDHLKADITIKFATGQHGDGPIAAFDGEGGTLAHAFFPENGKLHFDDDETFVVGEDPGTNLFVIAAHELGHTLGLEHSSEVGALMYPWYLGFRPDFKLSQDDIDGIQQIYGKPPIDRTEMTLEGPQKHPNPLRPDTCNTTWDAATYYEASDEVYAFRGRYYWAIRDSGVLPGYPRKTNEDFKGAPSSVHAVLSIENRLYMFRGQKMWLFVNKNLMDGFPRPIPDGLPSGPNAAFRWSGNGKYYIFKGFRFYEFNEDALTVGPPMTIRRHWPGVPVKLDAAFQWKNGRTYFFKGDDFWRYNDGKMKVGNGFPASRSKHWKGCV